MPGAVSTDRRWLRVIAGEYESADGRWRIVNFHVPRSLAGARRPEWRIFARGEGSRWQYRYRRPTLAKAKRWVEEEAAR